MFTHNLEAKKLTSLEYNYKNGYIKMNGWGMYNTELERFVSFSENIPMSFKTKRQANALIAQYDGSKSATECYNNLEYAPLDRKNR